MTSSVTSFLSSLAAGTFVVVAIAVALIIISKSDRVSR
nr:photosystem II protein X [Tenuicylindrus belgicus]UYC31592.1 photosystem II protein X [Tenuicylindrus belgicus]